MSEKPSILTPFPRKDAPEGGTCHRHSIPIGGMVENTVTRQATPTGTVLFVGCTKEKCALWNREGGRELKPADPNGDGSDAKYSGECYDVTKARALAVIAERMEASAFNGGTQ